MISVVNSEDIDFQLRAAQGRDPIISDLRERLGSENSNLYVLQDGIVFRKNRAGGLCLCVPSEMEVNLIRHIHEKIDHLGMTKCHN